MSKLSHGGIAGIVVGCVLVLLTILLCFYELRLRKKARLTAPSAGLPVPGASDGPDKGESYELGLGCAIPSYKPPTLELSPYGRPTHELSSYGYGTHEVSSYDYGTHELSSMCGTFSIPRYHQDDSTFEKVREVRPDPVGGEVWIPRLFEKVRVRLKTIQDDQELARSRRWSA